MPFLRLPGDALAISSSLNTGRDGRHCIVPDQRYSASMGVAMSCVHRNRSEKFRCSALEVLLEDTLVHELGRSGRGVEIWYSRSEMTNAIVTRRNSRQSAQIVRSK
jgi:hypothetical protein